MAARARNLVHRSGTIASIFAGAFFLAFGLLLWFTRTERDALQRVPAPLDTIVLSQRALQWRQQQMRADSALAIAVPPRRVAVRTTMASEPIGAGQSDSVVDTVRVVPTTDADEASGSPASAVTVRPSDTLTVPIAALSARLQRAQNAPLAASWRALAADPLLQTDARVRVLADSLAEAERERNEYDAVGGVDPIYLELSSRVTALGRSIERLAQARIAIGVRPSSAGLPSVRRAGPGAAELARRFSADSAQYDTVRTRRDLAARAADSAAALLGKVRTAAMQRDSSRARAQRRVDALAPPLAMLSSSAALAIGLALLVTVLLEVRTPRLADEREVAVQARVPVLLNIRTTDTATPDALTSAFSQLVFDLAPMLATARALTVLSDDVALASRTGARIAERLGYDGRSVRIMTASQGTARMTTRNRRRVTPTATQAVLVQPERSHGVAWTGEFQYDELMDDTISVRTGLLSDARSVLRLDDEPKSMVLLAVRLGSTPTKWLTQVRAEFNQMRSPRLLGVVIWSPEIDDTDPITFALDAALKQRSPDLSVR
jgi:hypothetical protein